MKHLITFLLLTIFTISYGQDTTAVDSTVVETKSKLSFSGSADVYFRQNIAAPNGIAPNTSFANLNGFALGMFNFVTKYESGKTGVVADLVFGPRGEDATFLSPTLRPGGSSNIVNQLYVYWNVNDKATFTMGNFNTFLGYEVISPVDNFNYSTSYMFSYGPFSHTGLKLDYAFNDDLSGMLAVLNNTDATEYNPNNFQTLGAQLGYKGTFLNALYGKQSVGSDNTFQVDLTGGYDLSKTFYLGVNSTYNETGDAAFYGVALYPQLAVKDITVGVRGEYFSEVKGGAGAIAVNNLNLKAEYRLDNADQDTFLDANLSGSNKLSSVVLAAVYSF
jgi:hypothetical protein